LENIIDHDFGGKKRQASRKLCKQLDLDALHEANIRDNPLPYLERASERIFQLEAALFDAHLALSGADDPETVGDTLEVSRNDYKRLLKCAAIVEDAFAALARQTGGD